MGKDVRTQSELDESLSLARELVYKTYIQHLEKREVQEVEFEGFEHLSLVRLKKFTYCEKEKELEKLTSVLNALNVLKTTYAYLLHSDGNQIEIYFAIYSNRETGIERDTLICGLEGNFPGVELENIYKEEIPTYVENKLLDDVNINSIAIATVVPREKNEDGEPSIQGIEKYIDAMAGEPYTALFLSQAFDKKDLGEVRQGLELLYTQLSVFKETDYSFNESESESVSKSLSDSITNTVMSTKTKTTGFSDTTGTTHTVGGSVSSETKIKVPFIGESGVKISTNYSRATSKSHTTTQSDSISEGVQEGKTNSTTDTTGTTLGEGRTYSFKSENKGITELLDRIDSTLERISIGEDLGTYGFAAYFLCASADTALRAATTYTGIVKGTESGLENSFINLLNEEAQVSNALTSLKQLKHPIFIGEDGNEFTAATMINTKELALGTSFPYKSVPGVPVLQFNAFSRNISTYDKVGPRKVELGQIYHMGKVEHSVVDLDVDSLTMHTFITGSTGSGKTNTTNKLIEKVIEKGVNVLVVEPAKGEYKSVFGGRADFRVYGTNPLLGELLQVNPFSFPEGIHVLEHIDRLIEIFNTCWPMYAAMPAILKEAIEASYIRCGWDLDYSINTKNQFPDFKVLLDILPNLINSSAYSDELKSNYIGSLVTRVKSLTNGLVGQIFNSEAISNHQLFETNVIVDLSRVGSLETKSLIMGILFLNLYEYRMSQNQFSDSLKHLTIFEEAHHLLKRSQGTAEGSDITNKSVEMIANGIAEMRAYGEGFVIVDQAPGLLDESVIRNTNTKIVLRLPDEGDRRLVGKAVLLTDEQMVELGRLRRGVGVVFQNNWLEPILCQISHFDQPMPLKVVKKDYKELIKTKKTLIEILLNKTSGENKALDLKRVSLDDLKLMIQRTNYSHSSRLLLEDLLQNLSNIEESQLFKEENGTMLSQVLYETVDGDNLLKVLDYELTIEAVNRDIQQKIEMIYDLNLWYTLDLIKHLFIYNAECKRDTERIFLNNWLENLERGLFL